MIRSAAIAALSVALTAFFLATVAPRQALATQVTDLIAERAMLELDHLLPINGELTIKMAEGSVQDGSFIKEFWIDPDSGRFIANVISEYGETHRVWGLAVMTVKIPVPARRLAPSEIIQISDLKEVEVPHQRLGPFAVQEMDQLVGQQVRRMLTPGRPVPRQSVIPPVIIERGEKVTITFSQGGLSLTANGRAMADAHRGQQVRVVNLSSNKTISGLAVAKGMVEVSQ